MSRYRTLRLARDHKTRCLEEVSRMLARARSANDIRNMLCDWISLSEAVMLHRRIVIAFMLLEGENQKDIEKQLGAGRSTIQTIARTLNRGSDGLQRAAERLRAVSVGLGKEIARELRADNLWSDEAHMRKYDKTFWPVFVGRTVSRLAPEVAAAISRRVSRTRLARRKS